MKRKINWLKAFGSVFILIVLTVLVSVYYVFMFIVNMPYLAVSDYTQISLPRFAYLTLVHATLSMLLWSFGKTTLTDPGKVPLHWGFHLDDVEVKKRRYCLICHIFKPERCHHCSVCNRCVLNMDHHCPWINNCIGFYNRKFFLLLLFYTLTTIFLILGGIIKPAIHAINDMIVFQLFELLTSKYDFHQAELFRNICILATTTILLVLTFLLVIFFKYHVYLLLTNNTTIEDLEKKRSSTGLAYDGGAYVNFTQVFGSNPWLWLIPVYGESGKPSGDGVTWNQSLLLTKNTTSGDAEATERVNRDKRYTSNASQ